ncbi:MAG TPA: hypothetical protein VIJ96_14460 [Acidothermaceae bacterium]
MSFGAVIFDWRGTLVTTVSWSEWARYALQRSGRDGSDEQVRSVVATLRSVPRLEDRLDCPGIDADAAFHREVYFGVFADAGLDDELARALYAVESDPGYNHFAQDCDPAAALMVGDRPRPDGGAVECGITTLLLPSLRNEHHQRLHHVLAMTR